MTASVFSPTNTRFAPPVDTPAPEEPLAALLVDVPETPDPPAPAAPPEPETVAPAEIPVAVAQLEMQSEFLRLLGVVTSMCDHVIEYIEADRAERRMMIETLSQLSRVITERSVEIDPPAAPLVAREHVIGGSMPAGPEPVIDLREPEPVLQPEPEPDTDIQLGIPPETQIEIAVEVRGRFGDRWVDGFEICEVMTTPDGPRYRLRRHRDGVVLPELFDATSIRHVETFEQLNGDHLNGANGYWSRS